MRQEKLNKNYIKKILTSLFDGSFWFGDDKLNRADKIFVKDYSLNNNNFSKNKRENFFDLENTEDSTKDRSAIKNRQIEILESDDLSRGVTISEINIISDISNTPNGYIKLYLKGIDPTSLFAKHNITLKYIEVKNEDKNNNNFKIDNNVSQKYIKSFILGNQDREIDCYSMGENESLTMEKHNSSILNVILKEKSGLEERVSIVNGIIIN